MIRTSSAFVAGIVLLATSCGGSTESGVVSGTDATVAPTTTTEAPPATDVFTTTPATTTPPATDAPTTESPTTDPPSAEPPPTEPATPSLAPADLVLRPDGIGPFTFGSVGPAEFAAALTPALGAPTQFSAEVYPVDSEFYFENLDDESAFSFPFGETVCFANALCGYFGGDTAEATSFVGYFQDETPDALSTPSGVTSGSVWADFSAAIDLGEGGCFSTGYGSADGVAIVVLSLGEPFEYYDAETEAYVRQTPAPEDVIVISLNGGDQPFFLYEDC